MKYGFCVIVSLLMFFVAAASPITRPATPQFTVTSASSSITVSWPKDGALDHRIYFFQPGANGWRLVAATAGDENSVTIAEKVPGQYSVRVFADNGIPSETIVQNVVLPASGAASQSATTQASPLVSTLLTPVIQTSTMAPAAVWFDGSQIAPEANSEDWSFSWSFGDANGKYNGSTTQPYHGMTASHIFENPGSYQVAVDVYDSSGSLRYNGHCTVNVQKNTKTVVHIAQGQPVILPQNAEVYIDGDVTTSSNIYIPSHTDVTFTNGAKITWNGPQVGGYILNAQGYNVITNPVMTSIYAKTPTNEIGPSGIHVVGDAVAIVHANFDYLCYCVNSDGNPTGEVLQDSQASPNTWAYFDYVEGRYISLTGNHATVSVFEHIFRVGGETDGLNVQYNDLSNNAKSCLAAQNVHNAYVGSNLFHNQVIGFGPLGRTDWSDLTPAQIKGMQGESASHIRLEGNFFYGDGSISQPGVSYITSIGNVFYDSPQPFLVNPPAGPAYGNRRVMYAKFIGNQYINTKSVGGFLYVAGPATGLQFCNNVMTTTANFMGGLQNSAFVYVKDADLSSFDLVNNNTWPLLPPSQIDRHAIGPFMVGGKWLTAVQWNALTGHVDNFVVGK